MRKQKQGELKEPAQGHSQKVTELEFELGPSGYRGHAVRIFLPLLNVSRLVAASSWPTLGAE